MTSKRAALSGILLLVSLMLLPGLVLSWLGLHGASGVAGLAGLSVLLASLLADKKIAVALLIPLAAASGLAVWASDRPWLAALLMAACSLGVGLSARRGYQGALGMSGITVAFILADPPDVHSADGAIVVAAIILGTGLVAAAIGWLLAGRVPRPSLQGASASRAEAYALVLALLTGVAAWCVSEWHLGHAGAWLILTLIVVIQPYLQDGWTRTLHRSAGTVLGFIIVMAASPVGQWPTAAYVLGAVSMFLALALRALHQPYWMYATFLTVAIVFIEGTSTSVQGMAWERLIATMVGALVALLAMAVLDPIYRRAATRSGVSHY